MARDGEGYCSFSGTTASKAGDESTVFFFCLFAYLLAECANFTGPVKGGEGQLRAMWLMA